MNTTTILFTTPVLVLSYDYIKKDIEKKYNEVISITKTEIINIFPFFEIISFVFDKMKNDYWFEKAMGWYYYLEVEQKILLIKKLENISTSKIYSQSNRHLAQKEYNNLRNL